MTLPEPNEWEVTGRPVTDAMLAAAELLYRALTLMPCTCRAEYSGNRLVRLSGDCTRCKAMRAWEEARG